MPHTDYWHCRAIPKRAPGLKKLPAEISTGRIDAVVVYKLDRLSRSLTEFAHR